MNVDHRYPPPNQPTPISRRDRSPIELFIEGMAIGGLLGIAVAAMAITVVTVIEKLAGI